MKLTYHDPTFSEEALKKCNILLDNKMQCPRKIYKVCSSDILPNNLCNAENHTFYMCQGHFNAFLDTVKVSEGNSIIDQDQK